MEHFFASAPRGLEPLLAAELASLGARDAAAVAGGVAFAGDWAVCYRANLWSRLASRVLWRVAEFAYRDSGLPGDSFSEGLVRRLPEFLTADGLGHVLVEWVHRTDEHWALAPRRWVEASYNLAQYTEMPRGGHFAAMEEPQLLVEDVRKFFRGRR